ncbi:MAG: methyltransferase domain-containing protein [candidate division NC10 bacterium]|nr:methyltransferase domain-containing protein [candidate division NC10 bacterium]
MMEDGIIAGNVFDKYGTRNPIAKYLMRGFLRTVDELVSLAGVTDIHEVGCGEGHLSVFLARENRAVRASDPSHYVIEKARGVGCRAGVHISFKVANIYELTSREDAAALVVCCEVLEHVPDPHHALRLLSLLAKPYLLVSVPREPIWRILNCARGKYLTQFGNTPGHLQHWSRRAFLGLLVQYVDIVQVRSPLPWTVALCHVRHNG